MAISVVQRNKLGNDGSQTTIPQAFGSNVTAGNKVIVIGQADATTGFNAMTGVTGSQGKTYKLVTQVKGSSVGFKVWIAEGMSGAAETVTLTTGNNASNLWIFEVTGLASSPFDQMAFANQSSATSLSSGSTPTLSFANQLVIGVTGNVPSTGLAPTVGAGYSNLQTLTTGFMGGGTEEKIVSATTAVSAPFGLAANGTNETTAVFTFADTTVQPTPQFIIGNTASNTTGTATTGSLGTTQAGNLIVLTVVDDGAGTTEITGVTDNKSNTYTKVPITGTNNVLTNAASTQMWYAPLTAGGAGHTVTVAWNTAATARTTVVAQYFIGFNNTPTLDVQVSTTGTSTSANPGTTPSTNHAPELVVIGAGHASTTSAFTLGSGYTNLTTVSVANAQIAQESKTVAATGTQTGVLTIAASRAWGAINATFYDASAGVSASVTQVAATVTAAGGTQTVATSNIVAVTQAAATVTASGGTQVVSAVVIASASITQVAANVTASGGTQTVAAVRNVSIAQLAASVTATGGTQVVSATAIVSVSITQVAATVTASGGTQAVASAQIVAISQSAANVTATGGTQVIATANLVSISQVAGTVTASGGAQVIVTTQSVNIAQVAGTVTASGGTQVITINVAITQVAANVTASGGTQTIATVNNVSITQLAGSITTSGGTQVITTSNFVSLAQLAGTVTAAGGTQTVNAARVVAIAQSAATVTASGGTQTLATSNLVSLAQVAATVTAAGGTQVILAGLTASIVQVAGSVTATGGTQTIIALVNAAIAQQAVSVLATTGTQAVRTFPPLTFTPLSFVLDTLLVTKNLNQSSNSTTIKTVNTNKNINDSDTNTTFNTT